MRRAQMRYFVFFTPLIDVDTKTYGDEIDVSNRIQIDGIGAIKRSLDSTDYNLGLFVFSDLTLKGYNVDGYFNDETDYRSIFSQTRDLCKVRVVFENVEITRVNGEVTDYDVTDSITFRGIINEEGTKIDAATDDITFKVLSRDSVFRTTKISGGVVSDGSTVKQALLSILDQPKITSVLNVDEANINPDLNETIDVGSEFDDISVNEGLNQLLLVSNSILYTNDAGDIIVKDRAETETTDVLNLYGKSQILGRENIITISEYNLGIHRCFTSFKMDTVESQDVASVQTFGYRQKLVDIPWITDPVKRLRITRNLLAEFKTPRVELAVQVPTFIAKDVQLLDRVSIDYPLRLKPPTPGTFLPVVGVAKIGDPLTPLPNTFGSLQIMPNRAFKVIEISDSPKDFTSTLKLRQTNDFVFNKPGSNIVGYAIIGQAVIAAGSGPSYNPSIIGAAKVGVTKIA